MNYKIFFVIGFLLMQIFIGFKAYTLIKNKLDIIESKNINTFIYRDITKDY
jgi:hypothetical protein